MNAEQFDQAIEEAMLNLRSPLYNEEAHQKFSIAAKIDITNLNEEFVKQAELYHEASVSYEMASYEENKLKTNLELAYAILDPQIRVALATEGAKTTEKTIESAIKSNAEYMNITVLHQAAKKNAGLWKAACMALQQKKDMLIQLGANYRAEGVSDTYLLQEKIEKAKSISRSKKSDVTGS